MRSHAPAPSFNPFVERTHLIEAGRTVPAAAMIHAGRHEQSYRVVDFRAHLFYYAAVVIHRIAGRNQLIVPAVVQKELAAPCNEFFQVGIGRIQDLRIELVGFRDILSKLRLRKSQFDSVNRTYRK